MPKYTKFLTPAEYDKLTIDEKAEYIIDMGTLLKSRAPASDPPLDSDGANPAPDDPPPPDGTNQAQDDPPRSDDRPTADPSPPDDKPKTL